MVLRRKHYIGILFTLNIIVIASAIVFVDCKYKYRKLDTLTDPYTCQGRIVTLGNATKIYGVTQNHLKGKSNDQVDHFRIVSQPLESIPEGIEVFFPNLLGLSFIDTKLTKLSKEDLQPFPQLQLLAVSKSQLEVLDPTLFKFTPYLKWIFFYENNIIHAGIDFMAPLKSLTKADFSGNICIDEISEGKERVRILKLKMLMKCAPTAKMIKDEIYAGMKQEVIESLRRLQLRVENLENQKHENNVDSHHSPVLYEYEDYVGNEDIASK